MNDCSLLRISTDVLACVLFYFGIRCEKQSLVNFWIGCMSYGKTKLLIHSVMLNMDIQYFFEKKKCSQLSSYLTSISPELSSDLSYLRFLVEKQKTCPRLQRLTLSNYLNFAQDSRFEQTIRLNSAACILVENFTKIQEFVMCSVVTSTSFLKKFPALKSVKIIEKSENCTIVNDLKPDCVFKNVTTLTVSHTNILSLFPNVVTLHLNLTNTDKNLIQNLDLSLLVFLENLTILLVDNRDDDTGEFGGIFEDEIDVVVLSTNLRKLKISPNVKIISSTSVSNGSHGSYQNLFEVEISDGYTYNDYAHDFRSKELFEQKHQIKSLTLNTSLESTFELLACTPQLTYLCIDGTNEYPVLDESKCHIDSSITNFSALVLNLPNLIKLDLYSVKIHVSHLPYFHYLCGNLTEIKWHDVEYTNTLDEVPPTYALKNIQSLEVSIDSDRWLDLIPFFCRVKSLALCFPIRAFETPHVKAEKFASEFFSARLELFKKSIRFCPSNIKIGCELTVKTSNLNLNWANHIKRVFKNEIEYHNNQIKKELALTHTKYGLSYVSEGALIIPEEQLSNWSHEKFKLKLNFV
jgi:hypothetical protein